MTLTLLDHADALTALNTDQDAAVARDVTGLFNKYGGRADLTHVMHTTLPDIIDYHAHSAGLLTAHWYDGIDPTSKFTAKPYPEIPREQIDKSIDWALHAPGDEPPQSRLTGTSQRLVRGASRHTVTRNAAEEGVRWARYARPDACAFCRALSIRGSGREDRKYLYDSDKSAAFRKSDGEAYHTHCNCEPIPIRAGQIWTPPEHTADWEKEYATARGKTERGPKHFQRIVATMRANEPKPQPESSEEDKQAADAKAKRDDLLKRLDAAADTDEIEDIAKELIPDAYSISFTSTTGTTSDPEMARGVVHAMDDVAQEYPDVIPAETYVAPISDENTFASTQGYRLMRGDSTVRLNSRWMTDPDSYRQAIEDGTESGFHYPGTDNPAYDTMIHELGHVTYNRAGYNTGIYIDEDDVNQALMDHYIDTADHPSTPGYEDWLRDNLSGYSFAPQFGPSGGVLPAIDVHEALAEAFSDTFINGENAHESSIVLTGLLTHALAGQTYTDVRNGVPVPA